MTRSTIYYFTGTGNSLKAAKDIASGVKNSELVSMAAYIDEVHLLFPKGTVGFVFPVYYCGLPKLVHEFISNINLDGAEYVYAVFFYGSTGGNAGCASQMRRILDAAATKIPLLALKI